VHEDRLGREARVAFGHADERDGACLDEQVVHAHLDGVLRSGAVARGGGGEIVVDLFADAGDGRGVDVDGEVEVGDRLLRFGEATRDRLAHHRERADIVGVGARGERLDRRYGRRCARGVLEIAGHDASARAGAGHGV
jgi:hypothetical protein